MIASNTYIFIRVLYRPGINKGYILHRMSSTLRQLRNVFIKRHYSLTQSADTFGVFEPGRGVPDYSQNLRFSGGISSELLHLFWRPNLTCTISNKQVLLWDILDNVAGDYHLVKSQLNISLITYFASRYFLTFSGPFQELTYNYCKDWSHRIRGGVGAILQ